MPRRNDRDNHNLRPRPTGSGGDKGAVARISKDLKHRRAVEPRGAECSEPRPVTRVGSIDIGALSAEPLS